MKRTTRVWLAALLGLATAATCGAADKVVVTAKNAMDAPRPAKTIELSAEKLAGLGATDLNRVHVQDGAGQEVLAQAVDNDGDHTPDIVIFQADFGANETKTFTLTVGAPQAYKAADYKAYGRFIRERFDDFAWENDRVIHRVYGKALETWVREPLLSSTIDVWCKATRRLVLNDWYMTDNYHKNHGEGADFYSAGLTRGSGGNGLWADGRLWTSGNFVQSRVLAQGPIRVCFELTYEPFSVGNITAGEVKRITLDAGQQFNHIVSRYQPWAKPGTAVTLTSAIGIRKADVKDKASAAADGWLATWEPIQRGAEGNLGVAIVMEPSRMQELAEDKLNLLALAKVDGNNAASYWAGTCWDKAGDIADFAAWQAYVKAFAKRVQTPLEISVKAE